VPRSLTKGQIAQLYKENAGKLLHVSRPFRLQKVLQSLYPEGIRKIGCGGVTRISSTLQRDWASGRFVSGCRNR